MQTVGVGSLRSGMKYIHQIAQRTRWFARLPEGILFCPHAISDSGFRERAGYIALSEYHFMKHVS